MRGRRAKSASTSPSSAPETSALIARCRSVGAIRSCNTATMLPVVRFCLMIEGREGVTWNHWLALACTAERSGFEALFRSERSFSSDHYFSARGVGGRGSDARALLGALAARTERAGREPSCRR